MKVILRGFKPATDAGLIFDSYPKGVYHGGLLKTDMPKKVWMVAFYEDVKRQLEECDTRIACLEQDPDHIVGYSIISKDRELQFVYVKELYRRKAIANLLTKNKFDRVNEKTLTKLGESIYGRNQKGSESPEKIDEQREDRSDDRAIDRD